MSLIRRIRSEFNYLYMEVALKIPNEWMNVPKVSTRTELMELRKKDNLPDISYDLDGDGVVSSKDYYLGKRFDLDKDGKLNYSEFVSVFRHPEMEFL